MLVSKLSRAPLPLLAAFATADPERQRRVLEMFHPDPTQHPDADIVIGSKRFLQMQFTSNAAFEPYPVLTSDVALSVLLISYLNGHEYRLADLQSPTEDSQKQVVSQDGYLRSESQYAALFAVGSKLQHSWSTSVQY